MLQTIILDFPNPHYPFSPYSFMFWYDGCEMSVESPPKVGPSGFGSWEI